MAIISIIYSRPQVLTREKKKIRIAEQKLPQLQQLSANNSSSLPRPPPPAQSQAHQLQQQQPPGQQQQQSVGGSGQLGSSGSKPHEDTGYGKDIKGKSLSVRIHAR